MKRVFYQAVVGLLSCSLATLVMAADPLANTRWRMFADSEPKAVVEITESQGQLIGVIVDPNAAHTGKTVIEGLKADGEGRYSGGKLIDPDNGKVYRLTTILEGDTLTLDGHLGPYLRSQQWIKQ